MLRVLGDSISGNCLKVKWLLDYLGIPYDWQEIDIMTGATRKPDFLALNPAGQVPLVVLEDGRTLAQSNAILLYFGEGSDLVPEDRYARGRMLEWMFWEQYSHEPYIAVSRFQLVYLKRKPEELDPKLMERGKAALARMEDQLGSAPFLAGDRPSLADIALVAYTRMADEGGFDLAAYPSVQAWIGRTESALRIAPRG